MKSDFVLLTELPLFKQQSTSGLLLNILEMWCCLLFRTLTKRDLETYLPQSVSTGGYGTHLNVALSLHQPLLTQDQETGEAARICTFRDLLHVSDPLLLIF